MSTLPRFGDSDNDLLGKILQALSNPPAPEPPGVTFIVDEDFEGAGAPSGWFTGGSADYDYSAVPLSGSQSLRLPTSADYAVAPALGDQDEVWGKFEFKAEALPAAFATIVAGSDSLFNTLLAIQILSTGALVLGSGTVFEQTVATMTAGVKYFVWWHWQRNGTFELWFDSVNVRPGVGNNHAGGVGVPDVALGFYAHQNVNGTSAMVYDNTQLAAEDFQ